MKAVLKLFGRIVWALVAGLGAIGLLVAAGKLVTLAVLAIAATGAVAGGVGGLKEPRAALLKSPAVWIATLAVAAISGFGIAWEARAQLHDSAQIQIKQHGELVRLRAMAEPPIKAIRAMQRLGLEMASGDRTLIERAFEHALTEVWDDLSHVVPPALGHELHFFVERGEELRPFGSVGQAQEPLSVRESIAGCAQSGIEVYWRRQPDGSSLIRAWLPSGRSLGVFDERAGTLAVPGRTCRFEVTANSDEKADVLCAPAAPYSYSPNQDVPIVACIEVRAEAGGLCRQTVRHRLRTILAHTPEGLGELME